MYPTDNGYFNLLHAALTERQPEPCPSESPAEDDRPVETDDDARLPLLPSGTAPEAKP